MNILSEEYILIILMHYVISTNLLQGHSSFTIPSGIPDCSAPIVCSYHIIFKCSSEDY